ncbi:zinc finger Y-chromosomal protein-like isoform X2 [Pundamilia nyererei]|uniref:Zinc finger Y-chromosomal protein-like isoform X2 n=1 Tax=Pundamilia nyererei TaxID=303518 RepID=A0A9Y6SQC6_9CICH|nr:PREDICTED: zinc finger Y-chromosomal protein-like isoform X2 [Pundamilia nyererei]
MKRGSSVLQPHSDAAKRHAHPANTHTKTHTGDDAQAAGSSPFPAATSLFSPDVSTKMASDLLIRLSEATQKAQMHPGSREEAEQQDEPGVALSPDSPGASPEPPSLTHTPDGNTTTDTLASDLLRKLAERQEVNGHVVRLKEEEEPMEVDTVAQSQIVTEDVALPAPKKVNHHIFSVKTEDRGLTGNKVAEELHPRAKMADRCLFGLKVEGKFCAEGCPPVSAMADSAVSGAKQFHFQVNMEDVSGTKMSDHLLTGAKMEDQLLFKAKFAERPFSGVKVTNKFLSGVKTEDKFASGAKMENQVFSGVKMEEQLFFGAKMEDQFTSGAKMADQCLRAVLWQDMSVNLASTLLHQLSERVSKSNSQLVDRMTPPIRSSPVLKGNDDQRRSSPAVISSQTPPLETQTSLSRHQTTGCSYFFRCHVCGFETEGQALFQSHMTEHRQWEHRSFSLHCCVCDHSTNQEAEMRAHVCTHIQGEVRCPVTLPATASTSSSGARSVATATQPETSTSEHRCRICQRSFPGQQELLVHFQGHRQGNQYRCDRCGHLTRTANKLVEHVRVHTGERPFTCDLCPYSAKRRDSLRLHCKVKHAAHFFNGGATDAPADVHTHRSYVHADNQRSNKHVQRLHTPPSAHTAASSSSVPPLLLHPSLSDRAGWRDLSPLLPITTLISLKQRSPSSSSSSSSSFSTKHSFLGYLGLTTSL